MCSVSEVNVSSKTPTVFQLFHCYSSWLTLQLCVQACTCYNMYVFAGVILCKFCALPCNNLTENLGTVTFLKYVVLLVQIGTLRSEDGDSIKNVILKVKLHFFNMHLNKLFQLTLSNVGELPEMNP